MKPVLAVLSTGVAVAAVVFALASFSDRAFADSNRQASEQARIERGQYLVHRVGMCNARSKSTI